MVRAHGRRAGLANIDRFETESLDTDEADIGKLIAALDANGYDVSNIGAADMDSATVNSREIYVQPSTPSGGSQGDAWIDTDSVE